MCAVFSPIPAAEIEAMAQAFGLGAVLETHGVDHGSVNTIYRLVTARGTFYLRREEVKTPLEVRKELRLQAYLAGKGFPCPAPCQPISQSPGDYLLPMGQHLVSFTPEMPGRPMAPAELNLQTLSEIGTLMANLHTLTAGFSEPLADRFSLASVSAIFQRARSQLQAGFPAEVASIAAEIAFQEACGPKRAQLPQGIVHGDLFVDNLFIAQSHISGCIDFDAAASRELLFDLATSIHAHCWLPSNADLDWTRVEALCASYQKIRPLTEDERQRIVEILRLSALRFTITRIQDFHLRQATKSGLIHRDFREFHDRLTKMQGLSPERFWRMGKVG